jgi:predicted  nucleic acid-binding Zn ribbon protein
MYTADIRFPGDADVDAVEALIAAWYKNGQVLDWQTAKSADLVRVLALLPKPNALEPANNNTYAAQALKDLAARHINPPEVLLLGVDPESTVPCACIRRESLVLFTTYMSKQSPLRCGDCFGPVPLYELPHIHDHEHLRVLQWAADYKACDTLQMHCTTGERFAESQLGRHDSALSRQGREIAAAGSRLTGIPIYYFLMKARGVSSTAELRRLCPSCGGSWLRNESWHGLFDFKCEPCRLVSSIANSVERGQH